VANDRLNYIRDSVLREVFDWQSELIPEIAEYGNDLHYRLEVLLADIDAEMIFEDED
jgi:hypothetical protein